ncbi:DUF4260 family protein [Actinoallomurus sp. CA-150999]|uniref:DUF4260 family protein n=1 Tax=Actinoallomurus sp. CA-150999 TaxID=3239887 RepID=UPI003D8F2755
MDQPIAPTRTPHPVLRIGWLALALFFTAFAVLEVVNHGVLALITALLLAIAPDLTMLIGASEAGHGRLSPRAVPYYNAVHRFWVPFVLLVAWIFAPVGGPPVFAAGLGWLAHIAYDRAFGYGLRDRDGRRRG